VGPDRNQELCACARIITPKRADGKLKDAIDKLNKAEKKRMYNILWFKGLARERPLARQR
jgi:hypothetical protein